MKDTMRWVLAAVAVGLLLWAPLWPGWWPRPRTGAGLALDAWVLVLLVGLSALRAREPKGPASWRATAFGAAWAALVTFEIGRAATLEATNDELPLYDSLLLARHLYFLGRDLYGAQATAALAAAFAAPLVLWALGALLLGRVEAAARGLSPRAAGGAVVMLVGLAGAARFGLPGTRWITPVAADNLSRSIALWAEFRQDVATRAHRELEEVTLTDHPDVVFYVVESYGAVVLERPEMHERWAPVVEGLEQRLTTAGWSAVTGLSEAPVHGGRSWIADASVLFGLQVAHESTYEHVMSLADSLTHLPAWFAQRGYETVLIKPKDRARPGIELENPFRFQQTVFALDLEYRGPLIGWGEIPDQYTIDRVEELTLAPTEAPVFAFFHLVSSHLPWVMPPKLTDHWSDWQRKGGSKVPLFEERSLDSELAMQLSRWRRDTRTNGKQKEARDGQADRYVDNVAYDLESITRLLERGVRRPRLVIVMGDHQPPLVARGTSYRVMVHVLSNDPELLRGFEEKGFDPGLVPADQDADLSHRELFATLIGALVKAQGSK